MNIYYEKIQQSISEYGKKVLNRIKEQYSSSLTQEQLQSINNLLNTEFIIIEKLSKEDIEFFSKQAGITNPEKYKDKYVPSAHGGRTKNDNKIHIYPYAKSFSDCKSDEEIIQSCIDSIVVHEIFHYLIRPNLSNESETIKDEFGHFITEGLVQYYAEKFAKENELRNPKSNYGKNVEFVTRLIDSFPKDLTQEDIDKIIFTCNQDELLDISQNGSELYQEFVDNLQFKKAISSLIMEMGESFGLEKDDEKMMRFISHYNRVDNIDIIKEELSNIIESIFKDNNMRDKYMNKLNNLINYRKRQIKTNQSEAYMEDKERSL